MGDSHRVAEKRAAMAAMLAPHLAAAGATAEVSARAAAGWGG